MGCAAIAEKRAPGRDGPLPAPVGACSALLLVAVGAVGEGVLRASLPKAAEMLLAPLEGSGDGSADSAGVFASDVKQARAALVDLATTAKKVDDEAKECCSHREHVADQEALAGPKATCFKPGQCED